MSELKYLLENKSDNSVLINRENVCTDILQQNITLLADSKYWHAFIIHHVKNPKQNDILKTVLDYIFPLELIPVQFRNRGNVCMFLARNCADVILKLCKDGLVISSTGHNSNLYPCEIILQYATIETLKHDVKQNVSTVLQNLFEDKTKTLNLENFSNNHELTEYSPLSQPKILYFVLHLARKLKPTRIKLNNNEIRRLFPLDALAGETALKGIDLRNNLISNIDEMKNLKLFHLTDLWLDGNPLCDNYEELPYIEAIKNIFPLLEKLDGVTIKKKEVVIFQRNFLCSHEGFDIVNQFIEHFFQIYDCDRTLLRELYHSNAVFSITSIFKRGLISSGTAKLDVYQASNRNLLNLAKFTENQNMLVKGNVEIVKKLEELPKTNHDGSSFCIDLIRYTDTSATISITGTFCEIPEAQMDPERHLGFNRLFLIGRSGDRYFIYNDILHVYNALNHQVIEAFTESDGLRHSHVAHTAKEKKRAIEAIQLVTYINKEWSKRLLADAAYDIHRFFKNFMKLLKLDKLPKEAYNTSKGYDKNAFLKWIVTQVSSAGVLNFKEPIREEILEYLSESPTLLSTSNVVIPEPSPHNTERDKDSKELEENVWLRNYENLNLNVEMKQLVIEKKIAQENVNDVQSYASKVQGTSIRINKKNHVNVCVNEDRSKLPKQYSTSYDSVPMELSDDETKQTSASQLNDLLSSSESQNADLLHNNENQHQPLTTDLFVRCGFNQMQVEPNQTVCSSLYAPYYQMSFNTQHISNPNLLTMNNITPSVTQASVFIPPLPQGNGLPPLPQGNVLPPLPQEEWSPPLPQGNILPPLPPEECAPPLSQNNVLPPLPPEECAPPLSQNNVLPPLPQEGESLLSQYEYLPPLPQEDIPPLPQDIPLPPSPQKQNMTQSNKLSNSQSVSKFEVLNMSEVEKMKLSFNLFKSQLVASDFRRENITSGSVPCIAYSNLSNPNSITASTTEGYICNDAVIPSPCSEQKKTWRERNTRNNLIYLANTQRIAKKCNNMTDSDKSISKVTQDLNAEVVPPLVCLEKNDCFNAIETEPPTPRSPTIILTNDVFIPPSVIASTIITERDKKKLTLRPPTITLLQGKWTYIEQNEERAFRLIYGKWILMRKNVNGNWQELQDDFIKGFSCWRKHFPSYENEILHHILSSSCLKSFLTTSFDSILDPVTYWDFPDSVPHDLRPPQMKTLILEGLTNKIYVTPESGFGFISVNGQWVLLAEKEHNHWVVLTEKEKCISWINGKWTFNESHRNAPTGHNISVEHIMPKLGLFSKKWISLPTPTMKLKHLFGYWVLFRKNDIGRWNVARDDFDKEFICKKKHFPGDREPIPNPKQGTWKQPPNFHTAELSCLQSSFDKTIFDSIEFPVTWHHFLPTVPRDLLPPQRYLLLDSDTRKYVEKDITPDSNYGFLSVNGQWEIREKTEQGTWISVDTNYLDLKIQSKNETKSTSTDISIQEKIVNSSKVDHTRHTSKFDGTTATSEEEILLIEEKDQDQNESSSKEKCDELLEKSTDKHCIPSIDVTKDHESEQDLGANKKIIEGEGFVKSSLQIRDENDKIKSRCGDETHVINDNTKNTSSFVDEISRDIENDGVSICCPVVSDSVINIYQGSQVTNIHTEPKQNTKLHKDTDVHYINLNSSINLESTNHCDETDSALSENISSLNIEITCERSIEKEAKERASRGSFEICENDDYLEETEIIAENVNGISDCGCQILTNKVDEKVKVNEKNTLEEVRAINRLKRLNAWKKTIELIPSIPKLTLLNKKWIIVSDHPRLQFREFGIGNWQLLQMDSGGRWRIIKDDFVLANEKLNNPNNLDEYMSLIGNNKFESIPIPVINSDFPSSVPNRLRPPFLIEYDKKTVEINPNSGYACLLHGRNWILLKQDDEGKWFSLDEKYQNYVQEKLKNSPEKYKSSVFCVSKRRNNTHLSNYVNYIQTLSTVNCPWLELLTGDIPNKVVTPVTYWDVDGEEEAKPPKFALAETDGKKRWFVVRPNLGFGFVLEDGVWVLLKRNKYNEWNNLKISFYDGYILGYFLLNNRWIILRKYILGGQWEALFDYKVTPCTYWDFIGPEEEKPPRRIFDNGNKNSKIVHKNCGMGFLKKDGFWILMEDKNDKWSEVEDSEYDCVYKLIDYNWTAFKKYPDGKWVPTPTPSRKLVTYWSFNGLLERAPPKRIIFEENGSKFLKIINEQSGMGFVLDENIWVLVKEGKNGELIHVNHLERVSGKIGFESRNGKYKIISKDKSGNWIRSTNNLDERSKPKRSCGLMQYSFVDTFSSAIPVTFYDVPSQIPEHMRPPKYALIKIKSGDLKWERIRKNCGYGFIFKNCMWRLMKWTFARGWLLLDDMVDMLILGYKAMDGRWVPMKKENNELKPLFDPFLTPRVIEECYGPSEDKPPSKVNLDGVNILDVTLGTKLGFVKESDVWILMNHQDGNIWKRFEYFNDVEGVYGYKRIEGNFVLMKKNENGDWLRVCWDWNRNCWTYDLRYDIRSENDSIKKLNEDESNKKRRKLPTIFTQENIFDIMCTYESYLNSNINEYKCQKKKIVEPSFIETGIKGNLQIIKTNKNIDISFIRQGDIFILLACDIYGRFMPNNCLGYKLINSTWVLMRKDVTGSWLPKHEPIYTPKSFWNTIGSRRPPRRIGIFISGITKWVEVGCDLNLAFFENGETIILVKQTDGDWEIMTDDLEESPTLAFKIINHTWKRVKQNEFGEWILCSTSILLPILSNDMRGPKDVWPPDDFHIIGEDGYLEKHNSYGCSNIGFEQQDGVWVVMQRQKNHIWLRHPRTYNDEEDYGYKYVNSKYTLLKRMKKENGKWHTAEIKQRPSSLKSGIKADAANRTSRKTEEEKVSDNVQIVQVDIEVHSNERTVLKSNEIPISYDDVFDLPKYSIPPCFITIEKNGKQEYVKVSKKNGDAFIRRGDIWIYVKRHCDRWLIMNDNEGYKLIDSRWVLMKKCANASWLPAFDPISTPRNFYDTVTKYRPPCRVILRRNGYVEWVIVSGSTNLGFIAESGAWVLMKKDSNGVWSEARDDLEKSSRICFKLIGNKWQRVTKNTVGVWVLSSKQLSLPVQHIDIMEQVQKPPVEAIIVTENGESKRIALNAESPMGYVQDNDVWILMYLENSVWYEYKMFDKENTYGHKLIYGKWTLMKKKRCEWIPGVQVGKKWNFLDTKEEPKIKVFTNTMHLELAEINFQSKPKIFSEFKGLSQFERPPESLLLVENGICKRVSFLNERKYAFHNHNGVWILMKHDLSWKFAQYTADGLLGHKLIDKRFVVMKRVGGSNWECTFNPFTTPRSFYDTIGLKFQRPPLRVVLKNDDVHRWKIVSEENGLGFIREKDMWILMQRLSDKSWTNLREESSEEKIGYKIIDNKWKRIKKCVNGPWTTCTQIDLPFLCCDIPFDNGMSTPTTLYHSPCKTKITKQILGDPNSNLGFVMDGVAWILMKCDENGTWSQFDLFPGQEGTFGYTKKSFELVKKDSNNQWRIIIKRMGSNGMYLDFNVEKSDEPPKKKVRLQEESTKSQDLSTSKDQSDCLKQTTLCENSSKTYFNNLISSHGLITLKELQKEPRKNCHPCNILINTNGSLKRISLSTYATEVAFLKDDDVWIPIKKVLGEWKTFHSDDELLGYKIIDDRWVTMKNLGKNEWEPTFDPILTPRNYFDTIGPLSSKPPIRIVINENGIHKWKIVAEENGLGFLKQGSVWVVMSKEGESWKEVKDCSGEGIIGYEVNNNKWTKVKKGKDGLWKTYSDVNLPCLHWDYIHRDETVPPKVLPLQLNSCTNTKNETIRADSNKGFDIENGAWVLKQSNSNGEWERINIFPGSNSVYGFMYNNGWKVVKKGEDGKWLDISETKQKNEEMPNKDIKCTPLPNRQANSNQCGVDVKPPFVIDRPISYLSFQNVAYEKRPPRSVLINVDGTLKRIFLNQKNTKIGFQKQDDVWILIEKQNNVWRTLQNTEDGLLGFKLIDNRWVIMIKRRESKWLPTFDPVTTPRTFFDTVGPLTTRPPLNIVIQKDDGSTVSQTVTEENGFGFIKQEDVWVLMKKQSNELWTEYKDGPNQEILGYQYINNICTKLHKRENGFWRCHSFPQNSSKLNLNKEKDIKPHDEITEKNSMDSLENLDLNDLLPPLTSSDFHALPLKKVGPDSAEVNVDVSEAVVRTSTKFEANADLHDIKRVDDAAPLNQVEIYLAANPHYEVTCPELQNLLRECRPKDKPHKLIRRKFRLPGGKTVLFTIPKHSIELPKANKSINYQITSEVEKYLCTHPKSAWSSSEFMEILYKFKSLDSKVPRHLRSYNFLFPDGVERTLSLPNKNNTKAEAIKILAAEIEIILKNYNNHKQIEHKRKLLEDNDSNITRKKSRRK